MADNIKNRELNEISVTKDFLVTAADGKNYKTKHYNLESISIFYTYWYKRLFNGYE